MKKFNVLSLFDGISCGRLVLERANLPINKYYASEIIEIHYKLINAYNTYLKPYGVKPLWNEGLSDIAIDEFDIRHIGAQNFWYVLNKNAKVPDSNETVPSGYHYLVSIEIPNPKTVKMAFKRVNRASAKNFQELKWVYDTKCATCF